MSAGRSSKVPKVTRRKAVRQILGGTASLLGAAMASGGFPGRAFSRPSRRPNILFFLTDDQRYDAMSCAGNKILHTPNMDRIASGGLRFANAFVTNSLCRPSRTSILTGLYSHSHGVMHNSDGDNLPGRAALLPDQLTFPHLLQRAGYWTALVGKWHLLNEPGGFHQYAILPGQGRYQDPEMIVNGARMKFRGHVSDVVGDQALEFLENRPPDKPFCLLVHFKAPHRSWFPAPRFAKFFEDVTIPEPSTFDDTLEGRPEAVRQTAMAVADLRDFAQRGCPTTLERDAREKCNLQALVKNYYRVLLGVDENLGRVLDYLDRKRLAEETAVVYTSDNGFFLGDHGLMDKRLMYEESIRVPILVRYPNAVPKGQVDREHMVLNIDFAPTLLELAGEPVPSWMQGKSMVPLIEGRRVPWRHAFLYEYYEYPGYHCVRKNRGIRTERWKYIQYWELPEEFELYDLKNDPDETHNLAGDPKYKDVRAKLAAEMKRLRTESEDVDLPVKPAGPCGKWGIG
jgi:arylsulfatase A-like enzyme